MTEYSITPFGEGATMPEGYPIYDGLDSNSAQQALSAKQGKVLKGLIDAKADGSSEITRYSVNMCDESKVVSGTLDGNGNVAGGSGLVTDYMPAKIDGNKTQFIQVCASIFKTSTFGYRATKVCMYNSSKTYLGTISNVSAIIDKESQANASYFGETDDNKAKYIRVQFATGTSDHFVALTNKPVLPQYSPFNKADLTASSESLFMQIHNSDGAITNMLETALDYLNNTSALNLGYGDSATAFDENCEAVTCDPWNSGAYSGSKKQINCSTFVMLCLQGIRYLNSRYNLGSSAKNHGIGGYDFDDKTQTNYHNAKEDDTAAWSGYSFARHIPCSSHNKLYANVMLKHAYNRGFAYLIEDGFKNVEAGDVLFVSNSSNTFKDVGHTLFVSSVVLKQDGTKVITTMEDGRSGVHAETVTSKAANWVYGARFPLPDLPSSVANLVSSVSKTSFSSLNSGSTFVIGTLALSEHVKAKGVYTAVVKCSAVGDFEVMVGTVSDSTFTPLSTNGESLLRRGDGVTVKHFNLPVNSSVDTGTLAVAVKAYSALSSNVEIVEAKVYNGYVTE